MSLFSFADIIAIISERGIECRREGDDLVVKATTQSLDTLLMAGLREHKSALLRWFETQDINRSLKYEKVEKELPFSDPINDGSAVNVPLTPIQKWFFDSTEVPQNAYLSFAFPCQKRMNGAIVQKAIKEVFLAHDAFRLSFRKFDSGWTQELATTVERIPFESIDLSTLEHTAQDAELSSIKKMCAERLALERSPLLEAVLVDLGEKRGQWFVLVAHRLIFDGRSLAIVLDDFNVAYTRLANDQPASISDGNAGTFRMWAEQLLAYGNSPAMSSHLPYWIGLSWSQVRPLPRDLEHGLNTFRTVQHHVAKLDVPETNLLLAEVKQLHRSQPFDLLLAALMVAYVKWTGRSTLAVDVEGPLCREFLFENVDLWRTVGWFSSMFPIVLDVGSATSPIDILASVKQQVRVALREQKRVMPGKGIRFDDEILFPLTGVNFGVLRYMSSLEDTASLKEYPEPEIGFNHDPMRQYAATTQHAQVLDRGVDAVYSESSKRKHLLYLVGSIVDGSFQVTWTYSTDCHHQKTIKMVADHFIDALQGMLSKISHQKASITATT